MVDSVYTTESCIPAGDLDRHCDVPLTIADMTRSSVPSQFRGVLPPAALSVPTEQPAPLTHLCQQLLQIASTQSDCGQRLTDMAACIGKAFNVDGCAIAFPKASQTSAHVACWFADAPPLTLNLLTAPTDLFEKCLPHKEPIYLDPIEFKDVETLQSYPTSALSVSKFLQLWQSLEALRATLPQVEATLGMTTQLHGRVNGVISFMRSRPYAWTQAEIAGLQTVSHQVASTINQLQLQDQQSRQKSYQQVVNQLTLAIHNAIFISPELT